MACSITFDTNNVTGVLTAPANNSGVFEYIGYSTTVGGTYGAGGNWPNPAPAWGSLFNMGSIIAGFYKFKYKANVAESDPCYAEVEFIIPVVQGTDDVGSNVTIELCQGDAIRYPFADANLYEPVDTNGVTISLGGTGITSPGYSHYGTGTYADDTYDPTLETTVPITRVFIFTYTPVTIPGYTAATCCAPKQVTVTYVVTEGFEAGTPAAKAICNDGDL